MFCPTCRSSVPDGMVACPACVERKSRKAYLEHQKVYRDLVLNNRVHVPLAGTGTAKHIPFIGDPRHALCGIQLLVTKREKSFYRELSKVTICQDCRTVFERLFDKISAEAA